MENEKINDLIEKKVREMLEDIGIDQSNTKSRFEHVQDMMFLRKMRMNKQDVSKSLVRVVIDKIVSGLITLISCSFAAILSYFLSNLLHK